MPPKSIGKVILTEDWDAQLGPGKGKLHLCAGSEYPVTAVVREGLLYEIFAEGHLVDVPYAICQEKDFVEDPTKIAPTDR